MTDAQFTAWLQDASSLRVLLVEVIASIAGVDTTLYLSNRPYTTLPTDAPASTPYMACITGGGVATEELSLDSSPSISFSDIEIGNTGGVRDAWFGYVWTNRRIKVFMGDARWARSNFRQVYDGVVDDLDARDAETVNLRMLGKLQRLNNPISETTLGGTTQNKDALIPLTFGECFNVTPLLKDPATLEYLYHDSAAEGVIEVRSNGAVPVTETDSPTLGKFTLGVAPSGTTVTASVQGSKVSGVYANDISTLCQRIATLYGPTNSRFATGDLDTVQLAAFTTANPQPVGMYCSDRVNQLDAMSQLASSIGAQVVTTTLGLLRIVQLALPALGTPVAIGPQDIEYHSLKIDQRVPVQAAVKLGYCKNWTVQATTAAGVPAGSAALFAQEYMTKTVSDATVAATYKLDQQPVEQDTLLLVESDATAETNRRLALWKVPRTVYAMSAMPWLFLTELGDPVTLTHPRFNLAAGVTGVVVKIQRDWLNGRITLGVLA